MKLEVMRKLIIAVDSNQIPDQWMDKRTIETAAEVDQAISDWIDQKKAAQGKDGLQADADIEGWAAKK
jgi:hypothetical protein